MENERWRPMSGGELPSQRLRAARSMPPWMQSRGSVVPPPPPPPIEDDPPIDPDYEVIEFPGGQTYSNAPIQEIKQRVDGKRCDLCGSSAPSVHCTQCKQNFCPSCDDMYHRHPKRQTHHRKDLEGKQIIMRPPLPPKGEPAAAPVPPPRRNKRMSRTPVPNPLDQRDPSGKVGIVGSLKRMVGGRPLPVPPFQPNGHMGPHGDMQPQMPGMHGNMFPHPEWDMKPQRSGSFCNLNGPGFNPMMQAHSMAQLNCPSCHHGVMWDPWQPNQMMGPPPVGPPPWGMPQSGTWHSSAFLNRRTSEDQRRRSSLRRQHLRDSSSGSDDERAFPPQARRRNPSPALSRRSRNPRSDFDSEEEEEREERGWHKSQAPSRSTSRRASMADGINRAHRDEDTVSVQGGRRYSQTLNKREYNTFNERPRQHDLNRNNFNRGGRKSDFETISNSSRRYDSEDTISRQRKRAQDESPRTMSYVDDISSRGSPRGVSDYDEPSGNSRTNESDNFSQDTLGKKKNKRNDRFTDTGRRRTSPINFKYNDNLKNDGSELFDVKPSHPNVEPNIPDENGLGDESEEGGELGPLPETQWECTHCTFINDPGTRVCAICCKTTTKPKPLGSTNQPKPRINEQKKVTEAFSKMAVGTSPKPSPIPSPKPNASPKPMPKTKTSTGTSPPPQEKKGIRPTESQRNLTSKGTSPPPQSISTQTYEVTGHKLKRATSLADYNEWRAPTRSYSKQSLLSDTQSLPVTPPKSRSPELFNHLDSALVSIEQQPLRKNSEQFAIPQRNTRRAGSQPPDYISTLVQKQVKQGLEMVKLLREAEEQQFSADDLAVALLHCEDGDPVAWLQQNWKNMIDTVVTLATNYGHERKENTVGTISASEARDALRLHDGNVWAAVTECVEQRQKKYAELLSRGNFSREDIVTVLTANHGNLEAAYTDLNKSQLKPFLMRIWGPPQGTDNDSGDFTKLAHDIEWDGRGGKKDEEVSLGLSNESNNERIQSWLESYVHTPKMSQSMLQLNTISSRNSEYSDFSPGITKLQSNKFSKNRRYSDVHRYLTHCFTANNSLQISPSLQDLSKIEVKKEKVEKVDPLKEFLENHIGKDSLLRVPTSSSKKSSIEIASSENSSVSNVLPSSEGQKQTAHTSEDGGLSSSNVSPEPYLKLKQESSKSPSLNNVSDNDNSNETEDDIKDSETALSGKRDSMSTSDSYESVSADTSESYKDEDEEDNKTLNSNQILLADEHEDEIEADKPDAIVKEDSVVKPVEEFYEVLVNGVPSTSKESPKNLTLEKVGSEIPTTTTTEVAQIETKNLDEKFSELEKTIRKKHNLDHSGDKTVTDINNSPEIKIEPKEDNETAINQKVVEEIDEKENVEEQNDINENKQEQMLKNLANQNEQENTEKSNDIAIENSAKNETSNGEKEHLTINENVEDVSFNSSRLAPVTAIHLTESKSPAPLSSEGGNSDLDVSSIPTDSEKDLSSVSEVNQIVPKNVKQSPQEQPKCSSHELVSLLKESLAKEDVVERIVSTLFQTVLRASVDLQHFQIGSPGSSNKSHSKVGLDNKINSGIEESPDGTFYEAEENEEKHLTDPNGVVLDEINTSVETSDDSVKVFKDPYIEGSNEDISSVHNSVETNDSSIKMINDAFLELSTDNSSFQSEVSDIKEGSPENLEELEDVIGTAEREVRRVLAEGLVESYDQAELAVKLMDLNFDEEQCIAAAKECNSIEMALAYLQQECYLCAGKYTMKQMVSMLECEHICCQECANNYFTLQITERTINDCVCPFCKEPDLGKIEEDKALHYFSNLDIFLKMLVKENVHELFQRKLRDRTLMQDPNFTWCIKCSSGYIANPRQKRLICPDCKTITCASCRKLWQKEHEKMTCQEFTAWLEYNDPDNQLERHLAENGVTCPKCKTKYVLAKGGCMHLTCPHCKHEFCSGCAKPFLMGSACKVSPLCEKLGLHSHHPRNCLFYLRDKEPGELQRLLEDNGIDYRRTNEENLTSRCKVQLLKETDTGFEEAICGFPIEGAGFCRTHYIEHLVILIRNNKVDPVGVMDENEALQELRRHGQTLPTRADYKSSHEYLSVCVKIIKEHIPLD